MNFHPSIEPPDEPDPALGRVLQRLREQRGLSPAELAAQAEVEEAALSGIEAGTADPPWTTVEAIAAALEVSVESIASAVLAEDRNAP